MSADHEFKPHEDESVYGPGACTLCGRPRSEHPPAQVVEAPAVGEGKPEEANMVCGKCGERGHVTGAHYIKPAPEMKAEGVERESPIARVKRLASGYWERRWTGAAIARGEMTDTLAALWVAIQALPEPAPTPEKPAIGREERLPMPRPDKDGFIRFEPEKPADEDEAAARDLFSIWDLGSSFKFSREDKIAALARFRATAREQGRRAGARQGQGSALRPQAGGLRLMRALRTLDSYARRHMKASA